MWLVIALCFASKPLASEPFTIQGELSSDGIFLSDFTEDALTPLSEDFDWSTVRVVVAHNVVNPVGNLERVELASGHFQDGSIVLAGDIDEPIYTQICLEANDRKLSTLDALISPGATVSFVAIGRFAHLVFHGASRNVQDSDNSFSISGDFSSYDGEFDGAIVQVTAGEADTEGLLHALRFGTVMLDDGKFVIEAEAGEPRVVNVLVVSRTDFVQIQAVIEPGAEIRLSSQNASLKETFATARTGKHAQLVDAWQQSEEYQATKGAYRMAYRYFMDKANEQEANSISSDSDVGFGEGTEGVIEEEKPKYRELAQKLRRLRYDFLNDVASNAKDPVDALLALELGAHGRSEAAIPIFDRLAESLDSDLVARRLTIARQPHELFYMTRVGNGKGLTIGKMAPDFTLPRLDGEEVWLSEVLAAKDFVLVDFWASWCGPCIAAFPTLREMLSSYGDRGFEIISVSTDKIPDMWSNASEQYRPTWINLGELEGFAGEVAVAYGVNALPKSYLLDSKGRIVKKDLSTDQLKDFLVQEYGEPAAGVVP